MITVSRWQRIAILSVSVADLMIFSRMTIMPLIAMIVGVFVLFLGLEYSYRPASVPGLLVVATTSSASIHIASLATLGQVLTAIIGLLIPLLMLIWLALSAEEGDTQNVAVVRGAAATSVGYALACIWSVPITLLIVSLFAPTVAIGVSTFSEVSIMLVITILGGILILRRTPSIRRPAEPTPGEKS